jgi:intracellular septation protein A
MSNVGENRGLAVARIIKVLRFALAEFGPLIAFLLLSWRFGVKVAIAGTLMFVLVDGARRLWTSVPLTRIYVLTTALTAVFGTVDLFAASPFMLKYEAVITNVATAIAFAVGAYGKTPLLQEIAEQRQGAPYPDRNDVRRFFELFTLVWAAYFFLKAVAYAWMGMVLPLTQALALRSLVGGLSMAVMLVVSITQGRRLFFLCGRLGLLPVSPAETSRDAA